MIEVKGLRIGNYVYRNDIAGDFKRVEQMITVSEVNKCLTTGPINVKVSHRELDPIPITEDWLIKLGFDRVGVFECENESSAHGLIQYKKGNDYVYINKHNCYYQVDWNSCMSYGNTPILKEIKFVHEFQNVYFYLEGEELKINKK